MSRIRLLLPLAFMVPAIANSQSFTVGDIYTFAGTGVAGYSGDGAAATSAQLFHPSGVASDTSGNIYIADYEGNRIRKVSVQTNIITTIAGNGTAGYSGDGGPATSAQLYAPDQIAVDASGNVFFTDYGNDVVREVNTAGTITTVAGTGVLGYSGDGGPATSAELYYPCGIALDGSGNLYIADTYNQRVRRVTTSTGIISTYAGDGTGGYSGDGSTATAAELSHPLGLALDPAGNLYIADYSNARVRRVDVSTGYISTVAGNGIPGNSGDGGSPLSAEIYALNVWVAPTGDLLIGSGDQIRLLSFSNATVGTIVGNGTQGYSGDGGAANSAEIGGGPDGLAVDPTGNLYIADYNNSVVREVYQLFPGEPPIGGTTYYATTSSCFTEQTGTGTPAFYNNPNGPLTPNGGSALLSGSTIATGTGSAYCTWAGFPNVVTSAPVTLTFHALSSVVGSASETPIDVRVGVTTLYSSLRLQSGTISVAIPVGTNLSAVSIQGSAQPENAGRDTARLTIADIMIQ